MRGVTSLAAAWQVCHSHHVKDKYPSPKNSNASPPLLRPDASGLRPSLYSYVGLSCKSRGQDQWSCPFSPSHRLPIPADPRRWKSSLCDLTGAYPANYFAWFTNSLSPVEFSLCVF